MSEDYYQKKYESLMECFVGLQRELDQVKSENSRLLAEKLQWTGDRERQLQVIMQTVSSANATSNLYLEENKLLKQQVAELQARLGS